MATFEEYRFFAESTQHLSERRQAASGTYLTVNTAIFAVVAFLARDAGLSGWSLAIAAVPLLLVGAAACAIWHRIIDHYQELIRWRCEQLVAIEAELPGCHGIYRQEKELYFRPDGEKLGFSRLERRLPQLFLALYALYLLGIVVVTALAGQLAAAPAAS